MRPCLGFVKPQYPCRWQTAGWNKDGWVCKVDTRSSSNSVWVNKKWNVREAVTSGLLHVVDSLSVWNSSKRWQSRVLRFQWLNSVFIWEHGADLGLSDAWLGQQIPPRLCLPINTQTQSHNLSPCWSIKLIRAPSCQLAVTNAWQYHERDDVKPLCGVLGDMYQQDKCEAGQVESDSPFQHYL